MEQIGRLIEERTHYPLFGGRVQRDKWAEAILASDTMDTVLFITAASTLNSRRVLAELQKKYHIAGVFLLGKIFTNTAVPFYLAALSKAPSDGLKTAVFKGKAFDPRERSRDRQGWSAQIARDVPYDEQDRLQDQKTLVPPETFSREWYAYTDALTQWLRDDVVPADTETAEFSYVRSEQLTENVFHPEHYTKEMMDVRAILAKEDTRPLKSLAEILVPTILHDGVEGRILTIRDLEYPFDASRLSIGRSTDIALQSGDIIVPRVSAQKRAFLFNDTGFGPVFASEHVFVIRSRSILPEYLYFYLNTDAVVKVLDANCVGTTVRKLTLHHLKDLPVTVPKLPPQSYQDAFRAIENPAVRLYRTPLPAWYADRIGRMEEHVQKPESLEDVINVEKAKQLQVYKENQLREFLDNDVRELNTCYRNRAHKATLILAGSILEAVLIDWLSEMDGKDYFTEDYPVDGKAHADLIDYINAIKKIKHPSWKTQADNAHTIRKKRNLVHAKLCLAETAKIDDNLCKQVIAYLNDILASRGVKPGK